jgi:hypothetical protein
MDMAVRKVNSEYEEKSKAPDPKNPQNSIPISMYPYIDNTTRKKIEINWNKIASAYFFSLYQNCTPENKQLPEMIRCINSLDFQHRIRQNMNSIC